MTTQPQPQPSRWVTINGRKVPVYEQEFDHEAYIEQRQKQDRSLMIAATTLCLASLIVQGLWLYQRTHDILTLLPAIITTAWLELGFLYAKFYERSLITTKQKVANKLYQIVTGAFVAFGLVANIVHTGSIANTWLTLQPFASVASLLVLSYIFKGLDPIERANDAQAEAALSAQIAAAGANSDHARAERRRQQAANMRYIVFSLWETVWFFISFPFARQHRAYRQWLRHQHSTDLANMFANRHQPTPITPTQPVPADDDFEITISTSDTLPAPTSAFKTYANKNKELISTGGKKTLVGQTNCKNCNKQLNGIDLCTSRTQGGCYYRRRRAAQTTPTQNL